MLGSINVLPGTDLTTGAIVLTVFLTGAALAMIAAFGVVAFRRAGESGISGKMWRGGLVVVGLILAWALLDLSLIRDQIAERRALEARAAELTLRAIAPGSALACLDAVAGPAVEAACEKSLFASPEAVAAAVAYVDARVSLLSASVGLAERDQSYRPAFERLRRGIEADRFGLVSHVLMTRGCAGTDCPDLNLVRDKSRIMSNMRSRTFDAHISVHALAWNPGGVAVSGSSSSLPALAGAPQPPLATNQQSSAAPQPNPAVAGFGPATMGAASVPSPLNDPTLSSGVITPAAAPNAAQGRPKIDFPSSASIPAVSIMTPEPGAPPAGEAKPPPPPRRPAQAQAPRNQAPREASPRQPAPPPQPAPPQTVPPDSPPQTSGTR